jgi:hypothetical protein
MPTLFGRVSSAAHPLCCVGFYNTPVSRAARDDIVACLVNLAMGCTVSGDDKGPDETLVRAIVDQVQYYFSAENLDSDNYLTDLMAAHDGAVPIARLSGFRKMQQLTSNQSWVAGALQRAPLIEICQAGSAVRPSRRYTAREARDTPLKAKQQDPPANQDQDAGAGAEMIGVEGGVVVCAGLGAVLDVHGEGVGRRREGVPVYDVATDVPLPHAHHTAAVRMDKYGNRTPPDLAPCCCCSNARM